MAIIYWPNPAHKRETTEAGPPRWHPNKEACPSEMTVEERQRLLAASIPQDSGNPTSRRFAMRRTQAGIEFFEGKYTERRGDDIVFHGHPTSRVPYQVLKQFAQANALTPVEFRRLVRNLA